MNAVQQLGIGIQYNPEILDWFPFSEQDVDVLEILLDSIMGPLDSPYVMRPGAKQVLERLVSKYTLLAHSNYGCDFGFNPLNETPAVQRHVPLAKAINSPWVSNHCFYGDDSWMDIWSSPLQFSRSEVKRISERAKMLQDMYGVPLAHENAAYYVRCPGGEMREEEFLAELVETSGTYLHLDLHNIYANSINHSNYSVENFLNTIPLERVIEIHLAGGSWFDSLYHDWHDSKVPEPVWELLEKVLKVSQPGTVVIEFQGRAHHPNTRVLTYEEDYNMIKNDIQRAKDIWDRVYGSNSRITTRKQTP